MEVEILKEALELARVKNRSCCRTHRIRLLGRGRLAAGTGVYLRQHFTQGLERGGKRIALAVEFARRPASSVRFMGSVIAIRSFLCESGGGSQPMLVHP